MNEWMNEWMTYMSRGLAPWGGSIWILFKLWSASPPTASWITRSVNRDTFGIVCGANSWRTRRMAFSTFSPFQSLSFGWEKLAGYSDIMVVDWFAFRKRALDSWVKVRLKCVFSCKVVCRSLWDIHVSPYLPLTLPLPLPSFTLFFSFPIHVLHVCWTGGLESGTFNSLLHFANAFSAYLIRVLVLDADSQFLVDDLIGRRVRSSFPICLWIW